MHGDDSPVALSFGNYEVLTRSDGKPDELGSGGFGRTYRARHRFLGTDVALKVILDRLAFDPAVRKRFLKEAREHARLDHQGIARLLDFGEAEEVLYYAVELCNGGNLKEYVTRRGPLSPQEAMEIVRQAAEALHCAHGRGIVHRDVKPTNLLLAAAEDRDPHVKLIDFGLVKRIFRSGEPDETLSVDVNASSQFSPVFASPEQIRERELDERTDIFSLGMTTWFLMAGSGPVSGSVGEIIAERMGEASYAPQLPAALTGPLREIVAKMVEKETGRRWRNFAELLRALADATKAQNVESPHREAAAAPPPKTIPALAERFELTQSGPSPTGIVSRGIERATALAQDAAPNAAEAAISHPVAPMPRRGRRVLVAALIFLSAAGAAWLILEMVRERNETKAVQIREEERAAEIRAAEQRAAEEQAAREKKAADEATKLSESKAAEAQAAREKEAAEIAKKMNEAKAAEERALRERAAMEEAKKVEEAKVAAEKAEMERIAKAKAVEEARRAREPANATKEKPFVNSLGMQFVPVPGTKVLFCRTETRVRDFRAFARSSTGNETGGKDMQGYTVEKTGRSTWEWKLAGGTWEDPHFEQSDDHPVVCVSSKDADAFCRWLSLQDRAAGLIGEHDEYRLPTDDEWSAAAGPDKFPWGNNWPPPQDAGNFAGPESRTGPVNSPKWGVIAGFKDAHDRTAPAAQFAGNKFGLYDMAGNVWELCASDYKRSMNSAAIRKRFPLLDKEKTDDGTPFRVLRGGSWGLSVPISLQTSYRLIGTPAGRSDDVGFRVVLGLNAGL